MTLRATAALCSPCGRQGFIAGHHVPRDGRIADRLVSSSFPKLPNGPAFALASVVIRAARAAHEARNGAEYGVQTTGEAKVGFAAAMERMRRLRAGISEHDSAERLRRLGVDVFIGNGRFIDADTIEVDNHHIRFDRAVIATGARAAEPLISGLRDAGYYTNETIFTLTELPRRLAPSAPS